MNLFRTILTEAAPQENAPASMGNMFDLLLIAMLIGYGIYALYTAIRLRRTYYLFPSKILYPGNCPPEKCADEDGFIDYILPRITIWGISMVVMGLLLVLNSYVLKFSNLWSFLATIILPIISFVWYIVIQHKAGKRYW